MITQTPANVQSSSNGNGNGMHQELREPVVGVEDAVTLLQPSLRFKSLELEGQYLKAVSTWRRPVLAVIMSFDIFCFFVRISLQVAGHLLFNGPGERIKEVFGQLWNLGLLFVLVGLISWRTKRIGYRGAQQEEALLTGVMALAICNLLISLEGEKTDYVVACMFLISASTILKIRWWMGAAILFSCVLTALCMEKAYSTLPSEALGHLFLAWMCGTMVGYQSDYGRREMFASQERAEYAHRKEMEEAQARIQAQRELTAAHMLATEKSVLMAKEVAANEAKSEFMRVMCHEIRTPLNGCLASVEMLLETALREDQRELACIIRVCGRILLSTVSNFLDYFKIEAGGILDLVETEIDLPKLMDEIQGVIQAMVGVENQEIEIKDPVLHSVPPVILGDTDRLRGIILNLYSNAAKFTRKGLIEVSVDVLDRNTAPEPGPGYDKITLPPYKSSLTSFSTQNAQMPLTQNPVRKCPSLGYLFQTGSKMSTQDDSSESTNYGREKWLLFQVRDTGVGISGPGLKSLFKEYAQGSDEEMKRPRTNSGTGLGLNICLKQVGALGGRIGAFSKLGSGSVFWFTFPLKTPENYRLHRRTMSWSGPIDFVTEELDRQAFRSISPRCLRSDVWQGTNSDQAGPSKPVREESSTAMNGRCLASPGDQADKENSDQKMSLKDCRVLLVEDNLMNQKVAQKMLQSFCAECTIASNGLEAIDVLLGTPDENQEKSDQYDIVLMDMLMPKMGGIEATKILRQRNLKIPIVALTANALKSDYEECRIAGMDGFLSKPVLKGHLMECLQRVLQGESFPSKDNA